MIGPDVVARTMSETRAIGKTRALWQYHSRSDHHSQLFCFAIAVDLLATSSLMRTHAREGKITIGVNHEMADFRRDQKKNLDLVIARPADSASAAGTKATTLGAIASKIGARMTPPQQAEFDALPAIEKRPVGAVLVALEAKACMTEHIKSMPRMYDELHSSQLIVHGAADQAIAVGLAIINVAPTFVSPLLPAGTVTSHKQPTVTETMIAKMRKLPRRTSPGEVGFDAFGIMVINLTNDGASAVTVATDAPAPQPTDSDTYAAMILRTASLYDYRFSSI